MSKTSFSNYGSTPKMVDMTDHKRGRIALIVVTFVLYLAFLISPAIVGINFGTPEGPNSTVVENDITPAPWAFGVLWGTIFLWQFAWLVYGLTTIFRRSQGGFLYYSPPYMPVGLYISFAALCVTLILWYIFYDMTTTGGRIAGCVLLYTCVYESYATLFFALRALQKYAPELEEQGKGLEVKLVRGLVHNGLAELATWLSLAAMLNLTIVLNNDTSLTMQTGSVITLFCIVFDVAIFVMVDNFIWHKYTTYVFTPYAVLLIALGAAILRNYVSGSVTSILLVMLFIVAISATILKVALFFIRRRSSATKNDEQPEDKMEKVEILAK